MTSNSCAEVLLERRLRDVEEWRRGQRPEGSMSSVDVLLRPLRYRDHIGHPEHSLNLALVFPATLSSCDDVLFLRPGAHSFLFRFSEFRLWMHGVVQPRRHPAGRYQSADGFQFVAPLPWRIGFPLGKIQPFPSLAHVPLDPPGDWCNMAVPRPVSVIGVAVPTSPHQDLRRL